MLFQKLCTSTQSLEIKRNGLGADGKATDYETIIQKLTLRAGTVCLYFTMLFKWEYRRIHEITKIDLWFLRQIEELYILEKEIGEYKIDTLDKALLLEAKQKGFADRQIAHMLECLESQVYNKREELGIQRVYKLVDTCAAEFEAKTPYYYSTFEEQMQLADGAPLVTTKVWLPIRKKSLY